MRKTILTLITFIFFILSFSSISHASDSFRYEFNDVYSSDECFYVDTIITEHISITSNADMTRSTKTASKTNYYRDADQNVLWYVTITATFTYDGTTSSCISCSHNAGSNNSHWSIKSCTSSMSGNSATATAVATQTGILGFSHDFTGSVTIYCAPDGTIS